MPPKPSIPTPKDLDEAIQATNEHIDNAIRATHSHTDERFQSSNQNLESQLHMMQTRLDNQDQLQATRHASLKTYLADLIKQTLPSSSHTQASSSNLSSASHNHRPPLTTVTTSPLSHTSPLLQFGTPTSSPLVINRPHSTQLHSPLATTQFPLFTQSTRLSTLPPPPYNPHNPDYNHQTFQTYYNTNTQQPFFPSYNHNPQASSFPTFPPQFSSTTGQNSIPPPYRTPKLELSIFDGTDSLEWLFQADRFFTFYQIPMESRLSMSSFYMKGDALSWFKWMYQNNQLFDWISFTKAFELHFGPSTYANHQAELFKLRQSGTIAEYQAQFERLGNRVIGLPAEALLNCFISGLSTEIRNEMAIQHPTSITQAIGLAKLIEAKIKDSKIRPPKPYNQYTYPNYTKPPTTTTPPAPPTSSLTGHNPT
jgi:hypothetical protein